MKVVELALLTMAILWTANCIYRFTLAVRYYLKLDPEERDRQRVVINVAGLVLLLLSIVYITFHFTSHAN